MKRFVIYLACILFAQQLIAQCDKPTLIDNINVSHISSPYQLLFIHEVPQNRLDEIVRDFIKSNDSLECVRLLYEIGATKTPEAYCFLYTFCCRGIAIHDLNPFNSLYGKVHYYNGISVVNKYFLNGRVFNDPDHWQFTTNVILECKKNEPKCYYCKEPDYEAENKKELQKIDTRKYDKQIIEVIKKYSDLTRFGGVAGNAAAMDSIVLKLFDYEFVGEANWDKCAEKLAIYPGTNTLGVIIMINEKPVEKCYTIQVGEINRITKKSHDVLIYKDNYVNPGFIYKQVDICNPN